MSNEEVQSTNNQSAHCDEDRAEEPISKVIPVNHQLRCVFYRNAAAAKISHFDLRTWFLSALHG